MLVKARPNLHDPLPDGRTNPSLTVGKVYVVTSMEYDSYRLVNDAGEPVLFPCVLFDVLDDFVPGDWTRKSDGEGFCWWGPPELASRGFFEDWHDGHVHEHQVFAAVYERLWRHHEAQLQGQSFTLKPPDVNARFVRFEVEAVVEVSGHGTIVLARLLVRPGFTLGSAPKLGGCSIVPHLTQPRALTPGGQVRQDLFAFKLLHPEDARAFRAGQLVVLEPSG
jgi:hypothetical protein